MIGVTVAHYPAFALLGSIAIIILHKILKRFSVIQRIPTKIYTLLLTIVGFSLSYSYEKKHGVSYLMTREEIIIVWFILFFLMVLFFLKIGIWKKIAIKLMNKTRSGIDNSMDYINSEQGLLHKQALIDITIKYSKLLYQSIGVLVVRFIKPLSLKILKFNSEHFFYSVAIITCLQLLFPPVHVPHRKAGMISYGYQYLFSSDGLGINGVKLFIQILLCTVLLFLAKSVYEKLGKSHINERL